MVPVSHAWVLLKLNAFEKSVVKLLEKSVLVGLRDDSSTIESLVNVQVLESSSIEKDLFALPFCVGTIISGL